MRQIPVPAWTITILALAAACWLVSCGLPLVPEATMLEDNTITASMTKVMECRLKAIGPRLPAATLGPEPDAIPLLFPLPESASSKAFLVIPSTSDKYHNRVFDSSALNISSSEGAVLVSAIQLDPAQASHDVEVGAQYQSVDLQQIYLGTGSTGTKRLDISLYRAAANQPSRLAITANSSASYSYGDTRSTIYLASFPARPFNDTTKAPGPSIGGNSGGSTYIIPGYLAYYDTNGWQYHAATATSSGGSSTGGSSQTNGIALSPTIPVDPVLMKPFAINSGNALCAIPLADRFKLVFRYDRSLMYGSNPLFLGDFVPGLNPADPSQVSISQTSLNSTESSLSKVSNSLSGAFTTYNPLVYQGALTMAVHLPDAGGLYQYYQSIKDPDLGWATYGPFATDWPPVRVLSDGTMLSLRSGKWSKAEYAPSGLLAKTSNGSFYRTGSLQFLYEFNEGGETWMYFSQAIPVAGDLGRANDLVMRCWKIREADFLANNRY